MIMTKQTVKINYEMQLGEIEEEVYVISFDGEEEISHLYEYKINLVSTNPSLDASKILNKKATFIINRVDKEPLKINGIVSSFHQRGTARNYYFYNVTLVPRMWRLLLNHRSAVYQHMNVEDVVKTVLEEAGFAGSDYEFKLKAGYPDHEYVVQYRESDFQFINRRLEHFGIFYYFEQRDDNDVIIFTDSNDHCPSIDTDQPVLYRGMKDTLGRGYMIQELVSDERVVTGLIRLKDYNYEYPEKQLMAESQLDAEAPGIYYEYGDNFLNEQEGKSLARIRNQEIIATSRIFSGKSNCPHFCAGHIFKMDAHYNDDWNGDYLLTSVRVQGDQRGLFSLLHPSQTGAPIYQNSFKAIPAAITFRPRRQTPIPRLYGLMTARTESAAGEQYPFIDDKGRYRVKLPFDLSDAGDGEASSPYRLVQPYTGPGYGIHFPNHENTEMIWSCMDGNLDRPIGLGTVPNTSNASPVTGKNNSQHVILTKAGNEIVMDDLEEKAKISVKTPDSNAFVLDDENDRIEVATTNKHNLTLDDKNENITIKTTNGHMIVMNDKDARIVLQSKNGHRISINDKDGEESITFGDQSGQNVFIIDVSNSKLVIKSETGNIDLHAPNGVLDIKAMEMNIETTGDTKMKAANMETEAVVDYKVKGGNIIQEANLDFKQKGLNISSEASLDHKSKGLNLTVEAGVNTQVKGTMITVQSSGPNTIKGMPVMIN
jgi:type VI secretion system secreted protein VgrG